MKKLLASAAVLASATTPLVLAAPAQADTPGCVTRAEYRAVHKGYTVRHVRNIFDTWGHRDAISTSGGYGSQIRSYHTCSRYSAVSISFSKNPGGLYRLAAKSAVWTS